MALDGPMVAHEKAADDHEWAHWRSRDKLPMSLNGPILAHEKTLPMTMNGPILAHEESCR